MKTYNNSTQQPILVITHSDFRNPNENLGAISPILEKLNFTFEFICPRVGHILPSIKDARDTYAGLIVLGGNDYIEHKDHPDQSRYGYLNKEIHFVRQWIDEEKTTNNVLPQKRRPFLGICLGAQIMATAFGAKVTPLNTNMRSQQPKAENENHLSPRDLEIGFHPIKLNHANTHLKPGPLLGLPHTLVSMAYHRDMIIEESLPEGMKVWGKSAACPQVIVYRENAVGLQFHPEMEHPFLKQILPPPQNNQTILGSEFNAFHQPSSKIWQDANEGFTKSQHFLAYFLPSFFSGTAIAPWVNTTALQPNTSSRKRSEYTLCRFLHNLNTPLKFSGTINNIPRHKFSPSDQTFMQNGSKVRE